MASPDIQKLLVKSAAKMFMVPRQASKEHGRVFYEQSRVLKERTVCGVGIEDQLRVGKVLLEIEGVSGVEDDVGFAPNDEDRHLDVLQVGEAFSDRISPLLKSRELRRLHLLSDWRVTILHACIPALRKARPAAWLSGDAVKKPSIQKSSRFPYLFVKMT